MTCLRRLRRSGSRLDVAAGDCHCVRNSDQAHILAVRMLPIGRSSWSMELSAVGRVFPDALRHCRRIRLSTAGRPRSLFTVRCCAAQGNRYFVPGADIRVDASATHKRTHRPVRHSRGGGNPVDERLGKTTLGILVCDEFVRRRTRAAEDSDPGRVKM